MKIVSTPYSLLSWRTFVKWRNVTSITILLAVITATCQLPASADSSLPNPEVASILKCGYPLLKANKPPAGEPKAERPANEEEAKELEMVKNNEKKGGEKLDDLKKRDPIFPVLLRALNDGVTEEEFNLCHINEALPKANDKDRIGLELAQRKAQRLIIARTAWAGRQIVDRLAYDAKLQDGSNDPGEPPQLIGITPRGAPFGKPNDAVPFAEPDSLVFEAEHSAFTKGSPVPEAEADKETGESLVKVLYPNCTSNEIKTEKKSQVLCAVDTYVWLRFIQSLPEAGEFVGDSFKSLTSGLLEARESEIAGLTGEAAAIISQNAKTAADSAKIKGITLGKVGGKLLGGLDVAAAAVVLGLDIAELAKSGDYSLLADIVVDGITLACAVAALLLLSSGVGALLGVALVILTILFKLLKAFIQALVGGKRKANAIHLYYGIPKDEALKALKSISYPGKTRVAGSDSGEGSDSRLFTNSSAYFSSEAGVFFRQNDPAHQSEPQHGTALTGYAVSALFVNHLLAFSKLCDGHVVRTLSPSGLGNSWALVANSRLSATPFSGAPDCEDLGHASLTLSIEHKGFAELIKACNSALPTLEELKEDYKGAPDVTKKDIEDISFLLRAKCVSETSQSETQPLASG